MSTPENEQQYGSLLTVAGENAEQNGKLQNKQITFTHIAIGDANDTYVQPDRTQTALVNELHRIAVNNVDVLQATPDSVPMLKVEAVLPDDINGVVIREFAAIATFNGQEYIHAVGNCARIYVPSALNNGGVATPVTIEMLFVITSADAIVEIDPNVITASRAWVKSITSESYTVPTVETMKSRQFKHGDSVRTLGYFAVSDGGTAEYAVKSDVPTLPGDVLLNNGNVAQLQLKAVNDLRCFGVVSDFDDKTKTGTDNSQSIQNAISRADGRSAYTLTFSGSGVIGIKKTIRFDRGFITLRDVCISAIAGWEPGVIVLNAMNGDSSESRVNRGNPMIRVWRSDVSDSLGYTSDAEFRAVNFQNVTIDGGGIAPGISFEKVFNSTHNIDAYHCAYYGQAYQTKCGQVKNVNSIVAEFFWGEDGYHDVNLRTAHNIVLQCHDVMFSNLVTYYAKWPVWINEGGNCQFQTAHIFNGPTSHDGVYIGSESGGILFSNTYMDGVRAVSYATDVAFTGGRFLGGEGLPFMELHAISTNQSLQGLLIDGISGNASGAKTLKLIEENGNAFTSVQNSKVTAISKDNMSAQNDTFLTGKVRRFPFAWSDWVDHGSIFKIEIDLSSMICAKNNIYSYVMSVSTSHSAAEYNPQQADDIANLSYFYRPESSRTLIVYSNKKLADIDISVTLTEGTVL